MAPIEDRPNPPNPNALEPLEGGLLNRLVQGFQKRFQTQAHNRNLQHQVDVKNKHNEYLKQLLEDRNTELEQMHGVLASIHEGVIMQDQGGNILMINDAARKMLGNQRNFWDSALGALFNAYQHVDAVESELAPLAEIRHLELNNQIIQAQLAAIADRNGKRIGTIIVLRDTTAIYQAEQLKDTFLNQISHELKTPMTAIKLASELLPHQNDPEKIAKIQRNLERNIESLNGMITELVETSKIRDGSLVTVQEPVNIQTVLWETLDTLKPVLQGHDIEVKVMTRDADRLFIVGDQKRLQWALAHMIRNSIMYNRKGGQIQLFAYLEYQLQHDLVYIQLRDTGVGISEDDMPHIFDQFYRGTPRQANGNLHDIRGMGQGLFIAKAVAEAHDGVIYVESKVGQGTIFTLQLPAAQVSAIPANFAQ